MPDRRRAIFGSDFPASTHAAAFGCVTNGIVASRAVSSCSVSIERTIATTIHGRYLVDFAEGRGPHRLLVGFHGYGEHAAKQLDRLRAIRGTAEWSLVSIQALHRFYRTGSNETVAASWMTREDRELMIADNISYVNGVLDAVEQECGQLQTIVYAGFSQGASMAYRAATLGSRRASGSLRW